MTEFEARIAALSPEKRALLLKRLPPLSVSQRQIWQSDLRDDGATHVMPLPVRLVGPLDVGALERSITEVVRRHEVLRTCFPLLDGEPVQMLLPAQAVSLELVDLTHHEPDARRTEVQGIIAAEGRR